MGNYVRLASTSVSHWPAARSRKNILCPNSSPAMVTNHRGRASVTFFKTRNRVELCRLQTWTVAALNGCVSSATSHPNGNKINSLLTASVGITIQKERSRTGLLQRREESWTLRVMLCTFVVRIGSRGRPWRVGILVSEKKCFMAKTSCIVIIQKGKFHCGCSLVNVSVHVALVNP